MLITGCWQLTINDISQKATTLIFVDLIAGDSALIHGLDAEQFSGTQNRLPSPVVTFKRPIDMEARTFQSYIADHDTGNQWLRMEIVPHEKLILASLLANLTSRKN